MWDIFDPILREATYAQIVPGDTNSCFFVFLRLNLYFYSAENLNRINIPPRIAYSATMAAFIDRSFISNTRNEKAILRESIVNL